MQGHLRKAFDYCIEAEERVVGLDGRNAKRNGRMNHRRALETAKEIVAWARRNERASVAVLNLGGVNCGQVDLAMKKILEGHGIAVKKWVAFDSPNNQHLTNPWLAETLRQEGIELLLHDFSVPFAAPPKPEYDVVLACEVIEHLDYSDALQVVARAYDSLRRGGLIVVSVPNPFRFSARLAAMRGKDPWFDIDVAQHLRLKHYGHVNIYPGERLRAVLQAVSMRNTKVKTVNHWRYTLFDAPAKFFAQCLLDAVCFVFRGCGFTLIASGEKH